MKDIVLVTGSSGLIGAAVSHRLAAKYDVIGLDTHPSPREQLLRDRAFVDLTEDDSIRTALGYVRAKYGELIASFIHLAAHYDFSGEPSPLYESVTVRGTERLLTRLKDFEVEQFVFSSSMLIHAPTAPSERIHEDSALLPKWDYPRSKLETERLIHESRGRIPSVSLRIAGVYDDACHSIPLAHQMQRIYERQLVSHVYPGDTSHGQAFVHLDDAVEAIALTVERRKELPPELPLLIGEPETLSYEELQTRFGELLHGEVWETRQIPKAIAKAGAWIEDAAPGEGPFIKPWMVDLADDHFELDISRAKHWLGWEPLRSLRATLPKLAEALNSDPPRFYRENQLEPQFLEHTKREHPHVQSAFHPAH